MADLLLDYRQALLALHIVSFISWMAGMLYLPRLFVYHAGAVNGSELSETFKVMERRLLKAIMTPAMIATWLFGLLLLWGLEFSQLGEGWMQLKLVCVVAMTGLHGVFAANVRRFAQDENEKPAKYFRMINEVPTLLMIFTVFLVMVAGR
jgi:protoporphyrinogen IX oxidase